MRNKQTHRQKDLLKILILNKEKTFRVQELSNLLNCGEKTIRNDLDKIEKFIKDYPSIKLLRKPGIGISISIGEEDQSAIFEKILNATESENEEERIVEIAYKLLVTRKPITLQSFANKYFLPKSTIKKDLKIISDWLTKYNLILISKPRFGNKIVGEELDKRNALARLYELNNHSYFSGNYYVLDLFIPYEIQAVKKALLEMAKKFSLCFSDNTMDGLLVHVLIMIKRTMQKSPVAIPESEKIEGMNRLEYPYAQFLLERLEKIFKLRFPEEELIYFTWHLASSKFQSNEVDYLSSHKQLKDIVHQMIQKMEKLTIYHFSTDRILFRSLSIHMHAVLNRLKYGFPITNPLLSDIKKMYPYMFNMIFFVINNIQWIQNLPEDEVAYIVLHFQASIERMEGKMVKKRAIIVCHLGIGISHLLEAKIKQHFYEIDILACVSKSEIYDSIQKMHPDFIISTILIKDAPIPSFIISPLFEEKDKRKLEEFIEKIHRNRWGQEINDILISILQRDLFFPNIKKQHRYEVVEMLSQILVSKGFVNEKFVSSAVKREKQSATAIGGGIAIPHGSPSFIHETAIAVAILKEPIEWGNELVSIVFLLAFKEQDPVIIKKIMAAIAALSEFPLQAQKLQSANDFDEFLKLLRQTNQ
ncbi:BglG family transcription antiterminator [Garciella nitratireducens]|uniref:Activator of the mannose operon, transcriptional antiterminator n=1 Tax=Garciella nitratireducens DSM 15102 TaxID=1121911 RepID=A0A1T4L649_9FIRM|nr:BglG family transcription antiterminator [Garciella nitratireducens]SJZ50154.1 activator of the mannose operon, transcriptional antiterminator [Garciella nitratireducens DSM 15102]